MSDLPEHHDQEKSADTQLEESGGKEQAETKQEEEVRGGGEEKEVQVKEPVVEQDPSVTEEKKADEDLATKPETTDIEASQKEEEVKEKQDETTVEKAQDERTETVEEKVEGGNPVDTSEKDNKQPESEQASKSNEPVSTNVSADPSPAVSLAALRPLSPSSRTSTPPLTATTTAPAAKKFSAMNVNKKFLSKTGSPNPVGASAATKLNPLASKSFCQFACVQAHSLGRPISSPVPIAAPSSRLLSTTLTTVTSKPSVSPQPPSSASTSSPWAKPVLPASDSSSSNTKRGTSFSSTAPMGSGQGIASKPAWRAVGADGRRAGMGVNRDFPTASEVAEGKLLLQFPKND